jgi:hypothetical protein
MQVEIISHNIDTFIAEIKFTHNDVVVQDTYNLLLVEPTMIKTLEMNSLTFTPEMQQDVIDKLTAWVQRSIEAGGLQSLPA